MRVSAGIRASDGGRAEVGARHRRQALVGAGDGQRELQSVVHSLLSIMDSIPLLCRTNKLPNT